MRSRRHAKADKINVEVEVLLNRVVEGEYSRIPLHMMVVAAQDAGVPFITWKPDERALMLESGASKLPRINLVKLDMLWLNAAKERGVVKDLTKQLDAETYRQLRFEYLHHSADAGLVNTPHHHQGQESRHIYTNQEGG